MTRHANNRSVRPCGASDGLPEAVGTRRAFVQEQNQQLPKHPLQKYVYEDFFRLLIYYFVSSREIGYIGHLPDFSVNLDARLFWNRIWNLIVANPAVVPFDYINQGHVNLLGFEAEATWKPARALQFNLAYAWTELSSDDPFGINFSHSDPRHIGNLLVTWRLRERWQTSLDYYYASRMECSMMAHRFPRLTISPGGWRVSSPRV